jgi:adenylate kinase
MVRCVIIGAPGSGKGTQAEKIQAEFGVPVIMMSALLKQSVQRNDALGEMIAQKMRNGQLISDDIIWELLKAELALPQYERGCVLDGFPRTIKQVAYLTEAQFSVDLVLYLKVADEDIVERMSGRRVHPGSGRVYHTQYAPPKVEGVDDQTQEPLVQRDDDKPEVVVARLGVYHEQTAPVVAWAKEESQKTTGLVRRFVALDASQGLEAVWQEIKKVWKDCS